MNFLKTEPLARNAGIGVIVTAILAWVKVMGYVSWTPEQFAVTEDMVFLIAQAVMWIILVVQPRFGEVTPVVAPKDNNGETLVPVSEVTKMANVVAAQMMEKEYGPDS